MPLPSPNTGETSQAYVSRCISFLAHENSSIPEGSARAAACYARLRKARPGAAPRKEEIIEILSKMNLDCDDCILDMADEVLKMLEGDSAKMLEIEDIEFPEHMKPIHVRKDEEFSFTGVEKANTTNSPAWGSISHNQSEHPNKSDFIVQRGENWSDWKLPYKYKGKIHCGGVAAAYAASRGARGGVKGGLTASERSRLESARGACGFKKEEELIVDQLDEVAVNWDAIMHSSPSTERMNPSVVGTDWPELEEVDLPDHLRPGHERSATAELEDLLKRP